VADDRRHAGFAADLAQDELEFSLELADLADEVQRVSEAQQQLLGLFVALQLGRRPVAGVDGPVSDCVVQEAQVLREWRRLSGSKGCPRSGFGTACSPP